MEELSLADKNCMATSEYIHTGFKNTVCLVLKKKVSWFYDFWLLEFHIITSCSTLGVKDLMLQFWVPVPEEKMTYISQRTLCSERR